MYELILNILKLEQITIDNQVYTFGTSPILYNESLNILLFILVLFSTIILSIFIKTKEKIYVGISSVGYLFSFYLFLCPTFQNVYSKIEQNLLNQEKYDLLFSFDQNYFIKDKETFNKIESTLKTSNNESLYIVFSKYYRDGTNYLPKDINKFREYAKESENIIENKALQGQNKSYLFELTSRNVIYLNSTEDNSKEEKKYLKKLNILKEAIINLPENCENAEDIFNFSYKIHSLGHSNFTYQLEKELKEHVNSYAKDLCIQIYNKYN